MDKLQAIEIFAKVAELKSFTAAAAALDLSRTLVSDRVRELEDALGVRLLQRTTRRVALTEPGAAYLERVRVGLTAIDEAAAEAASMSVEPRGRLRVNAPVSFGFRHLAPAVSEFLERHPRIRIDLTLDDRVIDLVEHNVDVAVRIGELRDSSLVARKLASCRVLACASPDYLRRRGAPSHPDDLIDHPCLSYAYMADGETWRFTRGEESVGVRVDPWLRSNNGDAIVSAAASGAGIALQPDFIAGPLLREGALVEILPGWRATEFGIYAVYSQGQFLPAKTRAFIDHLVRAYAAPSWL